MEIKENKYLVGITILDILGTKGIWKTNPDEFLSKVTFLFDKYNESVKSLVTSILKPLKIENYILLEFKTFSDTVFIIFGISSKLIEESKLEV